MRVTSQETVSAALDDVKEAAVAPNFTISLCFK